MTPYEHRNNSVLSVDDYALEFDIAELVGSTTRVLTPRDVLGAVCAHRTETDHVTNYMNREVRTTCSGGAAYPKLPRAKSALHQGVGFHTAPFVAVFRALRPSSHPSSQAAMKLRDQVSRPHHFRLSS